jgi:hypothetical protein
VATGASLVERIQIPPNWAFDWVDEAYCAIGESLAEPAPDAYDPNWPPHKVFWAVDVPDGVRVGGTFVYHAGRQQQDGGHSIGRDGVEYTPRRAGSSYPPSLGDLERPALNRVAVRVIFDLYHMISLGIAGDHGASWGVRQRPRTTASNPCGLVIWTKAHATPMRGLTRQARGQGFESP